MAEQEWVTEDSPEYAKILLFNDEDNPLMNTGVGEKFDCEVYEAYARETKSGLRISLVAKVQAGVNLYDKAPIAGEYIVNDIIAEDKISDPHRFLISHRQLVTLEDFNHIIDLNRPDVLDPQTVFANQDNFKEIVRIWAEHHWISQKAYKITKDLPDGRPDLIDERIPRFVARNAGFKRTLSQWRRDNWISENQASEYAKTGQALKTLDDELSFAVEIG